MSHQMLSQPRAEFRNYPLATEELRLVHEESQRLDHDIHENNHELKLLNGKMARTDYEQQLLERLRQKEQVLSEKRRELADILQTQHHLEQELRLKKLRESDTKNSLANEYKATIEEKRRRQEEDKRREVQSERTMQLHNQLVVEEEARRRRDLLEASRRSARQEIEAKELAKLHEKEVQQREKDLYNQRTQALSYLESQKESSYKQYYQQFVNQQNRLHSLYERTAHTDQAKDASRQELIARGLEENASRQMKEYEDIASSKLRLTQGRPATRRNSATPSRGRSTRRRSGSSSRRRRGSAPSRWPRSTRSRTRSCSPSRRSGGRRTRGATAASSTPSSKCGSRSSRCTRTRRPRAATRCTTPSPTPSTSRSASRTPT